MGLLSRGLNLLVIETVFLALDFLVVGLRLWVRMIKRKPLEFNDHMIMLGLVCSSAL